MICSKNGLLLTILTELLEENQHIDFCFTGSRYCKISTISYENEKVSLFDKTRPLLKPTSKKRDPLTCGKNHVKFLKQAHYDSRNM